MDDTPSTPRPDEAATVFNPLPPRLRPDEAATLPGRTAPSGPRPDEAETLPPAEGATVIAKRYRIVRCLGQGGMGSVWLARDLKLDGREVALKMLPSILAGKRSAFRLVKDEALMAMKLSHANIATVRAFEEDENGSPFLVMDYVEGEALDEVLAARGPLSAEETRRLLGPVAAALDYAHGQGIVHRDVKPGNVMVRNDGTPFVLDFGIAREIQETMTRVTGKTSGGTLLYMSPEQLNGSSPKAAQDVYSFAAMAYECLAGRPPFARGQIEWQILHNDPEALPDGVPPALRAGIMAGLAKKPGDRPASCAGVLADDAAPITAAPPRHGPASSARPAAAPTAGQADDAGETVFLRKVRLGKTLEEASKAAMSLADKEEIDKLRELFEAAEEALRAGDKPAAGKLLDSADALLDARRERLSSAEERARKIRAASDERKRQMAEEAARTKREGIVARLEQIRQESERQRQRADDAKRLRESVARKWQEAEKESPGETDAPFSRDPNPAGDGFARFFAKILFAVILTGALYVLFALFLGLH